ncbi:MAG TPA: HAD-IA family hydrolase [Anaeromyxobacteraceae bacterium]|nr:HAD-IA family hydrolase [Anaeromyxobacteraceae bacterium]
MTPPRLAVLFDLDGTLVDTVELILSSMRAAFEGFPGRRPTDAEWMAGMGKPLRVQLAEFVAPTDMDSVVDRYRVHQQANHDRMTRAFEGAVEVVSRLEARGHPLGVVTSKFLRTAERTLAHVGLLPFVDVVVGADSVLRSKPDPEPVLRALALLECPPGRALFVGDSPHDVAAGNAAGVVTAAALWGACGRSCLEPAGPRHWLESIREVPALAERLEAGAREA